MKLKFSTVRTERHRDKAFYCDKTVSKGLEREAMNTLQGVSII